MRYSPVDSKLYTDRRRQFISQMTPGAIALFYSNEPMPRTADQFFPFRQDSTLMSLTGIDQPGTMLILYRSVTGEGEELLFISPADPNHAIWHGELLTSDEALQISGVHSVYSTGDWQSVAQPYFEESESIYVNIPEQEKNQQDVLSLNQKMAVSISQAYPDHQIRSAIPILRGMMMIKHPQEIHLIRKAIEVTTSAFMYVLPRIRPGIYEYEIEAEITYVFSTHGCVHAFEPIIASGPSACILHYVKNNRIVQSSDLVLMDFGAERAGLAGDMSRTIPASGRFEPHQKKMYNAVLRVLRQTIQMMRPGITLPELNKETGRLMESELIGLGILHSHEVKTQDPKSPLWKKYFMHGVSHHLGYDVHDISDRESILQPGMVLTCEPGIYIPEQKTGIRLENDILITESGPEDLMAGVPLEIEEIESLMNP